MIASLEGTVVGVYADHVIISVAGVGFRVAVAGNVSASASPGENLKLFTYLHVRENELALYGLTAEEDLKLFRLLLSVSGIGPRSALALLSNIPADRLKRAIVQEDANALAQSPGVGIKTAQRIIFQLKDKVAARDQISSAPRDEMDTDVIAALTGLGYSLVEAQSVLQQLPRDSQLSLEERIRQALAYLAGQRIRP